ncbi:restriction endonuclease subunit S [Yoonia sp. MH D7]
MKAGYKQTDVGIIPEDWEVKRLGALLRVRHGKSQREVAVPDGAFPILATGGQIGTASRPLYDKPSLLIGRKGTIDAPQYMDTPFWTVDTLFYTEMLNASDAKFLFYCAQTIEWRKHNEASGVPSLNARTIEAIEIPAPMPSEQRAIAGVLSDVDACLAGLGRLIAKKQDLKQAAMQQLLSGQTRLPGFSGAWEVKPLGDLLRIRHGKSQHAVAVVDGPFPILATGGQIGTASRPLYDKPSVLIGRKGTIDDPQYMDTPFWTVDTLFYSEMLNNSDAKFLFYCAQMIEWRKHNEASGVPSLNARTIEAIEIFAPIPEEQNAIAAVLSDLDAELATLNTQLEKTKLLKQAMMQELLTGRIRLPPNTPDDPEV